MHNKANPLGCPRDSHIKSPSLCTLLGATGCSTDTKVPSCLEDSLGLMVGKGRYLYSSSEVLGNWLTEPKDASSYRVCIDAAPLKCSVQGRYNLRYIFFPWI